MSHGKQFRTHPVSGGHHHPVGPRQDGYGDQGLAGSPRLLPQHVSVSGMMAHQTSMPEHEDLRHSVQHRRERGTITGTFVARGPTPFARHGIEGHQGPPFPTPSSHDHLTAHEQGLTDNGTGHLAARLTTHEWIVAGTLKVGTAEAYRQAGTRSQLPGVKTAERGLAHVLAQCDLEAVI